MNSQPVSYAQQALALLHRLDPVSPAYHTGAALLVHAALDGPAMRRALHRLAQRHDMLRSTFRPTLRGVERVVHDTAPFQLEERHTPAFDDTALRALARRIVNRPFALEAQVFRFVAVRSDDGRFLLVMGAHHIATDAWSNWVLIRDLLELYRQECHGERTDLAAVAGTYQEFVSREAEQLGSPRHRELAEHWRARCAGIPAGELPTDRPRAGQASTTPAGATHRLRITGDEVAALRAAAAGCEVTAFAYLLGCFQALVSGYGRQAAFLIGCPTSARHTARSRDVVGNFVNTLLFRADVTRRTTFRDLAHAAYRQVGEGIRAAAYPFALLPQVVRPARQDGAATLCRITFNLIGTVSPDPLLRLLLDPDAQPDPVRHAGLLLQPITVPQSEGQVDLAVHVQHSRNCLAVEFRYDNGLFEPATVARLAGHYRRLLAAAAAEPDRVVARTPLLDGRELADLMGHAPAGPVAVRCRAVPGARDEPLERTEP